MPRPKRSKIASSANRAPRAEPAAKPPQAKKAVVDEIEDESEGILTSVRRLPKRHRSRESAELRAAVRIDTWDAREKGKEAARNPGAGDSSDGNQDAPGHRTTPPSIETSRRESIVPSPDATVRGRGRQPAPHGTSPGVNDIVSSIEFDVAAVPSALPRMESTILGKPTFRDKTRPRAPSILGGRAGAARARSNSVGLEVMGTGDSGALEATQSTRADAVPGDLGKRARHSSALVSDEESMQQGQSDHEQEVGADHDDSHDFNPEDESTPLHRQKVKDISADDSSSTAGPAVTSSSRKRQRISEIQVPRSPSLPRALQRMVYGDSPARSRLVEDLTIPHSFPPSAEQDIYDVSSPVQDRRNVPPSMEPAEEDIYGVSSPVRGRPAVRQVGVTAEEKSYGISADLKRRLAELQGDRMSDAGASSQRTSRPQSRARSITAGSSLPPFLRSRTPEPFSGNDAARPSRSPATPRLPTARPEDPLSETNAPPRSSSSPVTPRLPTSRVPKARRQIPPPSRAPRVLATQDSPISSPPSLTHSPNYRPTKTSIRNPGRKKTNPDVPLTTATLQNLLPNRRTRRARHTKDEFDMSSSDQEVDASGLKSDDDELSYLTAPARRARTRTPGVGKGKGKTAIGTTTKPASEKSKAKAKPGSAKTVGKAPVSKRAPKAKRTYGPAHEEDDEDGDEDRSLEPDRIETPHGGKGRAVDESRADQEMKRLKRKFAVVDEWEMEFEEVQLNSDDKRMADAR